MKPTTPSHNNPSFIGIDFHKRYSVFCAIDCEGGEWDIFENPIPFRKVQTIRMEYHLVDGKSLEDLKMAANRM